MNLQAVLNDIKKLPPDKQEEVADFIAFLKTRSGIQKGKTSTKRTTVKPDSFFGMWADRAEKNKVILPTSLIHSYQFF